MAVEKEAQKSVGGGDPLLELYRVPFCISLDANAWQLVSRFGPSVGAFMLVGTAPELDLLDLGSSLDARARGGCIVASFGIRGGAGS